MANLMKFTHNEVCKILKHNLRENYINKNKDIDPSKKHLNYNLTPKRNLSEYEYYKKRKSELYCYNRKDVKTLASWIVTAPEDLQLEDTKKFFVDVNDFLSDRYGRQNVINVSCHFDEGVKIPKKDRWGNYIKSEDGSPDFETVGQAHLHFNFIPVSKDLKHPQGEKICAKEVLNPDELRIFHKDLSEYLRKNGTPGWEKVYTGITAKNGGNKRVQQLKEETKNQDIGVEKVQSQEVSRWDS